MLAAIALLLACQLAGEILHRLTGLALPGPVFGMLILLGWLSLRRRDRPELDRVAGWLIAQLSIMFLPAAVGIMEQGPLLSRYGLPIALATMVSTLLTLAVTALVFRAAAGRESGA